MNALRRELDVFLNCSPSMRVLILANVVYALVMPVIDIFVAAYVMRNSHSVDKVVAYQLSIYTATPIAFFLNGLVLGHVEARHLYAAGMLLSGLAIMLMMQINVLSAGSIVLCGLMMGGATGLFWANRGFLALATTTDQNRNYYYGVEMFSTTLSAVVVPAMIGFFISATSLYGWLGGSANNAYHLIAAIVLGMTVLSAGILERGRFRNPRPARFIYFRFHPLWRKMLCLALLKGLAQGYIVTAPAMLIMLLVGKEGALGGIQAVGGILSAVLMYVVGRLASPRHRQRIFVAGLLLFFGGALINALLFNVLGVLMFMGCLVLSKPLLDLAYYPIQLGVIDVVSQQEHHPEYAYIFNHELGLYIGRAMGCGLFLAIAALWSGLVALKYALPVIALFQLFSISVASRIQHDLDRNGGGVCVAGCGESIEEA